MEEIRDDVEGLRRGAVAQQLGNRAPAEFKAEIGGEKGSGKTSSRAREQIQKQGASATL